MNKAMATLSETVGEDVPTFEEVREKIELRYARAKGASELTGETVEARMLEVEQAAMNTEASARLAQIRSELGLAPAPAEGDELLKQAEQLQQPAAGGEKSQPS
jgi:phage shock protein A